MGEKNLGFCQLFSTLCNQNKMMKAEYELFLQRQFCQKKLIWASYSYKNGSLCCSELHSPSRAVVRRSNPLQVIFKMIFEMHRKCIHVIKKCFHTKH